MAPRSAGLVPDAIGADAALDDTDVIILSDEEFSKKFRAGVQGKAFNGWVRRNRIYVNAKWFMNKGRLGRYQILLHELTHIMLKETTIFGCGDHHPDSDEEPDPARQLRWDFRLFRLGWFLKNNHANRFSKNRGQNRTDARAYENSWMAANEIYGAKNQEKGRKAARGKFQK